MGALFCLDNTIEIDNEEVPILDGSAKNFMEKILSTGLKKLTIKMVVIKEVNFKLGEKFISIKLSL